LKEVLPPDDSAIQFSLVGYGVAGDLDAALAELHERYVARYSDEQEVARRSDDEVWRVFRTPLERRNILPHLAPKKIVAPDYEYQFGAAWKNDIWLYETVSFNLVGSNSLLEKADRWVGRSANLIESAEPLWLHLLVGAPQDRRLRDAFAKAHSILRKMSGNPELIMETVAEVLAADLERGIGIHDDGAHNLFDLH